jgi:hypothetical protein
MSRSKKPPVLTQIEKIAAHLKNELWKRERYATGRTAHKKIDKAQCLVRDIKAIEQFVREHIPEEQWKGFIG